MDQVGVPVTSTAMWYQKVVLGRLAALHAFATIVVQSVLHSVETLMAMMMVVAIVLTAIAVTVVLLTATVTFHVGLAATLTY